MQYIIVLPVKILFLFFLAVLFLPIGILYGVIDSAFWIISNLFVSVWKEIYSVFRSLSKLVSLTSSKLLNRLLKTPSGVPFGTHSVSAVLGANKREGTLSDLGKWLADLLDSVEENHCQKSAERAGI
jgi:hypothetical protein